MGFVLSSTIVTYKTLAYVHMSVIIIRENLYEIVWLSPAADFTEHSEDLLPLCLVFKLRYEA